MSYPILYSATETNFDHNGIGILSACVSCEVTEEANGIFELAMTYPMDGVHYSQISDRCLIKAKPNNEAEPQLFRVYSIKKTMSGVAIVCAKHISYDLSGIPVSVFTADNAPSAMMGLAQNAVVDCPFVFMTDKTTVANFSVRYPGSIRSKLGGSSGSILDVYGGEYEFDNYNVILHHQRGRNRGVSIRYGKNLTDIQQDRNCGSVATGVYPYWFDSESEEVIELPEKIVNVDGTYDFSKIKMLALSDDFTSKPTEDEIRSHTKSYIKNNNVGVPDVSLSVSFRQLEQTEEYKGLALLEKVSLFDTVSVEFPALGVSATAKAVKIIYNVIMNRVESVTLGSVKSNIADTLANQQQQIEQAPSKNYVQSVANAASAVSTAWLTNGKGYKVERRDANGNTVDTLYMDTPDIDTAVNVLRIGQSGIGFSKNGVNGPYYSAWTLDGRFNADFIQAGSIKSNDGESVVIDLDNGRATLSGSLTATSGETKAVLSAGKLAMYYNSVRYGFLSSINWGRDADDPKGITLSLTNEAKFFSVGSQNDNGYSGRYVINLGANPGGHKERHHFYDDARFHGSVRLTGSNYFDGSIYLANGKYIYVYDTDGNYRYLAYADGDNNLWLGNPNMPTTLRGTSVEIRNLIDPTLDHHAVPKGYMESYVDNLRHRNYLDNWYFPNAVNQRGAKSYWSKGFTIDRWKFGLYQSSGAYVYPNKSDVTLHNETAQGTACSCYLEQTIDEPARLAGKTVTFSAKLRGVTVAGDPILRIYTDKGVYTSDYIRSTNANSIVTLTATLPTGITSLAVGIGCYASYGGDGNFNIAIESMKLEIGSVSTLAYDKPPDKTAQLLECQRYFVRFSNTGQSQFLSGTCNGTACYGTLLLPMPLRGTATPTVTGSGVNLDPFISGGNVAVNSVSGYAGGSRNWVIVQANYTATNTLPAQTPANIRIAAGGYIDVSAEI